MSNYEKLEVWQNALNWACDIIKDINKIEIDRKHYRLFEQIEASSTSVAMNIAEGNGRFSKKEFIQFLYIARGSLYETLTLLEVFHKLEWITISELQYLKANSEKIAKQLNALINSIRNGITP